ncbi:class I SAM-dependent methyltransferase [Roseomonas sp. NAR14]|uniref:Class I SAM-dependent methyltransferase n=1 Tax=Roseomonas acroporae TaxID=2937791 RepID=A0A9X1Y6L8_9PROT|nr:class I SAM-dependent methyltransferase [Roseomonas acroporae]MCK8784043.1 class I SAM-dependent methyltransferase [Roseomonas acroporae]
MGVEVMGWSRGYVADAPYIVGYQPVQAPSHLALVCGLMGVAWEPPGDMVIGELGCGRGYTALAIAAANPRCTVIGLDYNPAHIAEARSVAAECGLTNARFLEADLAEMDAAELDRLPEFDCVTLHGLWTWVADPVREGVVRLLRRRLKPGGIAMVSYNSLPGFATGFGVQRLVQAAAATAMGGSHQRALAAIDVVRDLTKAEAHYLAGNPWATRMDDFGQGQNPAYITHEFLTDHWRPAFFADLAAAMGEAKLDFVGSASLVENFNELMLTPEQRAVQERLPPGPGRELVKDLCLQRGFRKDVFVRGAVPGSREQALGRVGLALTVHRDDNRPKLVVPAGEVELPRDLADAVLRALQERPHSVAELLALPEARRTNIAELLMILVDSGVAVPLWPGAPRGPVPTASAFNAVAARRYAQGGLSASRFALAAPATGAALPCAALEMEVVARLLAGLPPSPAALTDSILPPDAEANDREAAEATMARLLAEKLPVYRNLGIL